VALELIFKALETIFWLAEFFFGSPERQKWPPRVAGSLSPWPLGWIAATPRPLGVDHGHPQWPDLFFFWVGSPERHMATEGSRISPPSHRGGSRAPPVARSIFFFFFALPEGRRRWATGDGGWRQVAASVAGGG
jgi:hypothetical protein